MDQEPMSSPFVDRPQRDNDYAQGRNQDQDQDQLQERINALEYQLNTEKSEREQDRLWYEKSIRDYEQKIKDEGGKKDELESNQEFLYNQQLKATEELETIKENFRIERAELENQLRQSKQDADNARDALDEFQASARASESTQTRELKEFRAQNDSLQASVKELQEELELTVKKLEDKQNTIVERESEISELKSNAMNAKNSNEDYENMEAVQRDLSEQISYTHQLEDKIAKQKEQIKQLTDSDQLLQVVQEEKDGLVKKVEQMDELRQRAVDAEMKIVQLEQEKQKWTSYLEKDDNFSTPEDVVRALMRARVEKIGLLDRLGRCEAELSAKDVSVVDDTKSKEEIEEWKMKYEKEATHRARIQRQKDLTARECKFLRDQMSSFDTEEQMHGGETYDKSKSARISELEALLDESRKEVDSISKQLAEKEGLVVNLNSPKRRPRQSDIHDERLSEALRKNRNLQSELETAHSEKSQFEQELNVLRQQIASQEEAAQSKHRILELRANPTAKYEKIKTKQLDVLRRENEDLQKQLHDSQGNVKMVPISVLERTKNDIEQLERQVQDQKKSKERLSKVYQKLSTDLRQAVYALVGYQIDPQPNKKVKVKSIFSHSEDEVLTFIPDPTSKQPKFVGIEESSSLTQEFDNLVTFWVKERKDIPCFLAALNLELYDKTTKAARF